jgi:hypothetical protein
MLLWDAVNRVRTGGLSAVGVLGLTVMSGGGRACTQAGCVGEYSLRSGSDTYDLLLGSDQTGALSLNGQPIESFKWEWDNDQPFLQVSGATTSRLEVLAGNRLARFRVLRIGLPLAQDRCTIAAILAPATFE